MKRFITLLLALVLSFSLFAGCKKKDNTTSTPIEKIPVGSTTDAELSDALSSQIEEASSLKIKFQSEGYDESVEYGYIDEAAGNSSDNINEDYEFNHSQMTVDAVLSVGADGKLDAEIVRTVKSASDPDEQLEVEEEEKTYIIDNDVYMWNESIEAWVKQESNDEGTSSIINMVKAIKNGEFITETFNEKLYAQLGQYINTTFNIKEYKGSIYLDGAPSFKELIKNLSELDVETETVSTFLDYVLKFIDKDATTETFLADLKEFLSLTVEEAIDEIDSWLTDKYEISLQGLYDGLVKYDPFVYFIMEAMGDTEEDEEALINKIKTLKIADEIANVKDKTLYDCISGEDEDEDDYFSIDDLFSEIEEKLDYTVVDFEETVLPLPLISIICESMQNMTLNKLDVKMDIEFTKDFYIESVYGEFNYDVKRETPSDVEGETDIYETKSSATLTISEISADTVQIAIPEEDRVLDFWGEGLYTNYDEDFSKLNLYPLNDGFFELTGTLPSGTAITFKAKLPLSAYENPRIEIDPSLITVYVDSYSYNINLDKSIIIQISGNSFVVEQMPDLGFADVNAWKVLTDIAKGDKLFSIDSNLGIESISLSITGNKVSGQMFFADKDPLTCINFDATRDYVTGKLICTITNYKTEGYVKDRTTGESYTGSVIEDIPFIFGDDIQFTFYVTEDGVVKCDDIPTVIDEYLMNK